MKGPFGLIYRPSYNLNLTSNKFFSKPNTTPKNPHPSLLSAKVLVAGSPKWFENYECEVGHGALFHQRFVAGRVIDLDLLKALSWLS
jgi:hypothetical protein